MDHEAYESQMIDGVNRNADASSKPTKEVLEGGTQKKQRLSSRIGQHVRVLFTGFKNMIVGALTLGLFLVAIAGFWLVSRDDGYTAVGDFIISCFTFVIAIASMYFLGIPKKGKRRGGKYEKDISV